MRSDGRINVLISEPGCRELQPFLPYMWAVLKSYNERHGSAREETRWLAPIGGHGGVHHHLDAYAETRIDVLGLSCYMWNWNLQCQIAAWVKARNPESVVVAGGPHPDYKDPGFFLQHPYIDAIAVKDGEVTFSRILANVARGERDLHLISGLYLPETTTVEGHVFTGPPEVPSSFAHSPYIDQSSFLEANFRPETDASYNATWETNRGCPYACSYCDWGSATMSKVRRFEMDRVEAELEWLARMRPHLLFLADANFGILPRDVEIAELLCKVFAHHRFPRYFAYSNAKNNPDRSVEISRKLFKAGLVLNHELSIQHTRPEVLAATDRDNISPDLQVAVVRELMADGVPIDVQLIRGIPGDTYELSKLCLADLMELGIHETYQIYPYLLLPNAPAAEPSFLEEWAVETVERPTFLSGNGRFSLSDRPGAPRTLFVVASRTFSREDWVSMNVYGAFVQALHCAGITRLIAQYMRLTHGVPYREIYESIVEGFCRRIDPARGWYEKLEAHYSGYLQDSEAIDFMRIEEVPAYPHLLQPYRWALVQICMNLESFMAGLRDHLTARYPRLPNLASVIEFQENLVVLPSYQRDAGKRFVTDRDWMDYFERANVAGANPELPEPVFIGRGEVSVSDRTTADYGGTYELHWDGSDADRWVQWIEGLVVGYAGNRRRRHLFQELRLSKGEEGACDRDVELELLDSGAAASGDRRVALARTSD
jgi:putative methyltransferase